MPHLGEHRPRILLYMVKAPIMRMLPLFLSTYMCIFLGWPMGQRHYFLYSDTYIFGIYMREIFFVALHGVPPFFFNGLCYADGYLSFLCFLFFMYDGLSEMHSSLEYC